MIVEIVKELKGAFPAVWKLVKSITIPAENVQIGDKDDLGDTIQKASWLALPVHVYLLNNVDARPTTIPGAVFCSLLTVTALFLIGLIVQAITVWLAAKRAWRKGVPVPKIVPYAWSAIFFETWAFSILLCAVAYLIFHELFGIGGKTEPGGGTLNAFPVSRNSSEGAWLNSVVFVFLGVGLFVLINYWRHLISLKLAGLKIRDLVLVFLVTLLAYHLSLFVIGGLTVWNVHPSPAVSTPANSPPLSGSPPAPPA